MPVCKKDPVKEIAFPYKVYLLLLYNFSAILTIYPHKSLMEFVFTNLMEMDSAN